MRAPLSWIREFTPVDAPVDEIVGALNQLGLEVEGVEEPGREIAGVVVADVLQVLPHPNADKLSLVDINDGTRETRVVCGAPNVVAGMHVPFAPAGATLPGGFTLERRKIRGETSDGMLCSAKELGLGEDHSGILGLDASTVPGTDVREVLGLDDVVFDIAVTPNRPDAMCIVGVARELAAHFGVPLSVPGAEPARDAAYASDISVTIESPDRCPRYLGWSARVAMGPSPAWMQQRLVKAGMRPISNVVDVTNYVLLERNQPLHAFDLGRLPGRGVIVRLAKAKESITTLDGVARSLTNEDLLICDAKSKPQAIAGIMGGSDSEVDETTTEILLEAAYFERMGIARSSKRLKLRSEASARFERGIDPDAVASHAARAMALLVEVAGAGVDSTPIDEHVAPFTRPHISLRTSKVNRLLGTELTDTDVLAALSPLGIDVEGSGDAIVATPPSFRPDLEREVDLVEEVARRVGFASIGRTVPKPQDQIGGLTGAQQERRVAADALVGAGFFEAVTLPLVGPSDLERFGAPTDRVIAVANPLRAEDSALRTQILPGLLRAVATNQARGLADVSLFEIGRVFLAAKKGLLPDEKLHLAGVVAGSIHRSPIEGDRPADVYDAVDAVRVLLDALEIADHALVPGSPPGMHPTRAAMVRVGGTEVGSVGQMSARVCESLGVTGSTVAFELDLGALLDAPRRDRAFVTPSPYPPATIDLAFVVAVVVPAASIESTLRAASGEMLEDVHCFDEFTSDALGDGRRSLAFRLRYRAADRTLKDAEVAALRQVGIDAVIKTHGAELRA
ncbi:MAG: phenylalanine--tRNA ligase subunit beta [Acidimicrobiia bacterium]|nr:phenylalanine--tRNA ligase subunit beta [Acidimicrobiia bacterium]